MGKTVQNNKKIRVIVVISSVTILLLLIILLFFRQKQKEPVITAQNVSAAVQDIIQSEQSNPFENIIIEENIETPKNEILLAPNKEETKDIEEKAEIIIIEENPIIEITEEKIEVIVIPPYRPPVPDYMVLLPGGVFSMGSPVTEEDRYNDELRHNVRLKPFYISKYEVSQRHYEEIMKKNPSYYRGQNLPVESVSWFDAIEYCNALSLRDGLPAAYTIINTSNGRFVTWNKDAIGYRLPTEAEWEYACRAGTTTAFNTGETINRNSAHYLGNRTRDVGSFRANSFGLYDMHGNVSEWCWDLYTAYGTDSPVTESRDPEAPRVFRGGNWYNSNMRRLRSAYRDNYRPSYSSEIIGFRIVRNYE